MGKICEVWKLSYFFSRFMAETEKKNEILIENEQLKHENLLVQLTSLKNQLNPHFLFNSLNTLSWLINEDKAKSQRYLQKLSQVLRYSLSMQEQSLVSLKEELALVENYIYLLKMRFGDNLNVNIKVENSELLQIPPLSLQLLLENAIKHNAVSKESVLTVGIDIKDERLIVKNNINPKQYKDNSSGMGLQNIINRYNILTSKQVQVNNDHRNFIVTLPLIKK